MKKKKKKEKKKRKRKQEAKKDRRKKTYIKDLGTRILSFLKNLFWFAFHRQLYLLLQKINLKRGPFFSIYILHPGSRWI